MYSSVCNWYRILQGFKHPLVRGPTDIQEMSRVFFSASYMQVLLNIWNGILKKSVFKILSNVWQCKLKQSTYIFQSGFPIKGGISPNWKKHWLLWCSVLISCQIAFWTCTKYNSIMFTKSNVDTYFYNLLGMDWPHCQRNPSWSIVWLRISIVKRGNWQISVYVYIGIPAYKGNSDLHINMFLKSLTFIKVI